MNIGHARRKITPQGDIYLIGYRNLPNRLEPATGVHDDVFANAILFQQGEREVFLFNADVLEFEESMAEEVKTMLAERYGIDRDCVLLSATHDHTSIVAYHRSWWTGKFDENYYRWFLDTICQCFEECRANAQPAICRLGKQVITGFYDNRIIPGELADNEVIVVSFFDTEGKPFAGFVNWAVHSACVGPDCTELTSELAGLTGKSSLRVLVTIRPWSSVLLATVATAIFDRDAAFPRLSVFRPVLPRRFPRSSSIARSFLTASSLRRSITPLPMTTFHSRLSAPSSVWAACISLCSRVNSAATWAFA